jgi:hypothetical protein
VASTSNVHFSKEIEDQNIHDDVTVFNMQESNHSRLHDRYNKKIESENSFVPQFFKTCDRTLKRWIYRNRRHEFLCTLCLEYFTYVFSKIITRDRILGDADPEMQKFWYWHAIEEIDHKSISFQVADIIKISYFERVFTMLIVLYPFSKMLFLGIYGQAKDDKLGLRTILINALKFFFLKEKLAIKMLAGVCFFFVPNHRPDNFDDTTYLPSDSELENYFSGRDAMDSTLQAEAS